MRNFFMVSMVLVILVLTGELVLGQTALPVRGPASQKQRFAVADIKIAPHDVCGLIPIYENQNVRIAPPRRFTEGVRTATFDVTYIGFTPEAQAAFQRAVDIWESILVSPVPIKVIAKWEELEENVLGAAGPSTFLTDGSTLFPIALGEALSGSGFNDPDSADIDASFSSVFTNWYLGLDGNTPPDKFDFVSVVLHELGHGLGFLGSMQYDENSGEGNWGLGSGMPMEYDRIAFNGSNQQLIDVNTFPNPSVALGNELISNNLFTAGAKTVPANGGTAARIYAPNPWEQGSSYSHFDEVTFNGSINALMTPQIGQGESIHTPGPLMLALFEDLGWTVSGGGGGPVVKWEETFVNATPPAGWQTLDVDGNGTTWNYTGGVNFQDGSSVAPQDGLRFWHSSFESANGFLINDWLITPQLNDIQSGDELSFYAGGRDVGFNDSLAVLVSTTDTNPQSFTLIDYFKTVGPVGNWTKKTYDLSTFAGNDIYVAVSYFHQDGGINGTHSDNVWVDHFTLIGPGVVGIEDGTDEPVVVSEFSLEQNYPNPFNPVTHIRFALPQTTTVDLAVFNMLGQKVATLVSGLQPAGAHEVTLDARNLSSGVYFYQLQAGDFRQVRKMLLTR